MANTMTPKQLEAAMKGHSYMLMRYYDGTSIAVNCQILQTIRVKLEIEKESMTKILGIIRPISLHEYISRKVPFM